MRLSHDNSERIICIPRGVLNAHARRRALHHAAAVGLNGKLYVMGGFVEGWTPTDEVHEYDLASDRWHPTFLRSR
jgi:Kelch motif